MDDRKESSQLEARKAKVVGVQSNAVLWGHLQNEVKRSREGIDEKCGRLNLLGTAGTAGMPWESN